LLIVDYETQVLKLRFRAQLSINNQAINNQGINNQQC